jgi:hypothetical protein
MLVWARKDRYESAKIQIGAILGFASCPTEATVELRLVQIPDARMHVGAVRQEAFRELRAQGVPGSSD